MTLFAGWKLRRTGTTGTTAFTVHSQCRLHTSKSEVQASLQQGLALQTNPFSFVPADDTEESMV